MNEIDTELNRLLAEQQLQSQGGGAFSNSTFNNCQFNFNTNQGRGSRPYYDGGDDDPCQFCVDMYGHNYGDDSKCESCDHYIQIEKQILEDKRARGREPRLLEDFEWALIPFEMIGKILVSIAKNLVANSNQAKQIAYNKELIKEIDYIDTEIIEPSSKMTQEELDAQIEAVKQIQAKSKDKELNEFSKRFQEELQRRIA